MTTSLPKWARRYEIYSKFGDDAPILHILSSKVAYSSLIAAGETIHPNDGFEYFVVGIIENIPGNAIASFNLKPFAITLEGQCLYGSATFFGCKKAQKIDYVEFEVSAPGLKTIKQCRIRKEMSMDDSAILKNSNGTNVKLNVGETVPLLSPSTISANGRAWYRILYNGMMLYVTADDESFEVIAVPIPTTPSGTSVTVNTGGANLNVRCAPTTSYTEFGKISNGSLVVLTNDIPQIDTNGTKWYAVYGQGTDGAYLYGWCSGEYLGNYIEYGTLVDVDTLNVRSGAGVGYTSLGTIRKGTTVEALEKNCATGSNYTWHKILYNGSVGYVVAGNNTPNFTFETRWVALVSESGGNENVDVSTLVPVTSNEYLTQKQMENNAMIIYDYLLKQGWSKNASCGAIANMQAESTINPGLWEKGNTTNLGFGLVQWTPSTKWTDYADIHGYNYSDLNRQLEYLIYSMQPGRGEWLVGGVAPSFQLYASEYISSTRSAYDLAIVFLLCYERPLDQSDSAKSYRGGLANNWFSFFNTLGW